MGDLLPKIEPTDADELGDEAEVYSGNRAGSANSGKGSQLSGLVQRLWVYVLQKPYREYVAQVELARFRASLTTFSRGSFYAARP